MFGGALQILNVEEELKRRNSMQGMGIRPSVPFQVDVANDSGSMSRHNTPRMGSEGNLGGDMDGGETEDVSNPSNHSRQIHRMSSTSPSSESPLRKPPYIQHNVVSLLILRAFLNYMFDRLSTLCSIHPNLIP